MACNYLSKPQIQGLCTTIKIRIWMSNNMPHMENHDVIACPSTDAVIVLYEYLGAFH